MRPVPTPASPPAPARRIERAAVPGRGNKEPAPAEIAPAGPASLEVVSRPAGAQVFFDGRSIGKTPITIPDVATGFHDVRLELAGFKGWSTTVGVKAGIATRVAASLEQ